MNPDLDTLATALYTKIDDLLIAHPEWVPQRPAVGIAPKISDAEVITLSVLQVLLRFNSEARFMRYARKHLRSWFPYIPQRPGYNKRLRRLSGTIKHVLCVLTRENPLYDDGIWVVDSTPVECGRSRTTQQRSDLAGWAQYGYSASHSRHFWGLRLHIIATPAGLPVAFALAGAKADEREICTAMIREAGIARPGQVIIADKGYRSTSFEQQLNAAGMTLVRPVVKNEKPRPGRHLLRCLRQHVESIVHTLKSQLGLERHKGRTRPGVAVRILQRILAHTATMWHNHTTNKHPQRSLTAYDH